MNNSHHTAITKRICEQKSRICTDLIRCGCEAPIAARAKYLAGSLHTKTIQPSVPSGNKNVPDWASLTF